MQNRRKRNEDEDEGVTFYCVTFGENEPLYTKKTSLFLSLRFQTFPPLLFFFFNEEIHSNRVVIWTEVYFPPVPPSPGGTVLVSEGHLTLGEEAWKETDWRWPAESHLTLKHTSFIIPLFLWGLFFSFIVHFSLSLSLLGLYFILLSPFLSLCLMFKLYFGVLAVILYTHIILLAFARECFLTNYLMCLLENVTIS